MPKFFGGWSLALSLFLSLPSLPPPPLSEVAKYRRPEELPPFVIVWVGDELEDTGSNDDEVAVMQPRRDEAARRDASCAAVKAARLDSPTTLAMLAMVERCQHVLWRM